MENTLFDVQTIYYEPNIPYFPRGQQILARFPDAEKIEIPSHWNIPQLHGNEALAQDWNKTKRNVLVLGVKKTVKCTPFYRSCDKPNTLAAKLG